MTPKIKLGDQPCKLTKDFTLFKNEKCIIETTSGALAVPIMIDESTYGYFFAGKGKLTLDTIIETPKGAIGKPLIKDLHQPFLMFSKISKIQESLAPATAQDISDMGYRDVQDFLAKSNQTLDQFAWHSHSHFDLEEGSYIFAFVNEHNKWDMLVSKGDKLVYTSKDKVYISKDQTESLELQFQPSRVLIAGKGKTVVISKDNILIDSDEE